jgi:hypothetical protein
VAGEHRSPAQATADAVVAACRAALDAGAAPTNHGVRPHMTVTVPLADLAAGTGTARTGWAGEVPTAALQGLLDDAGYGWMIVDDDGLPLAVGPETPAVPVGLWRALVERDRGCIAVGCDVPAGWCQVMHLAGDRAAGGRLSPETAGLGCTGHHRRFDHAGWQVTWTAGRPALHPPRDGPDG